MHINTFWALIERGKDAEEPEKILATELKKLSAIDLIAFQKHFDRLFSEAYRWDLWGAAYLIGGGCSDDGFMDFRYGLISMGRDIFQAALEDPDSLVNIEPDADIDNEMFGYVAQKIYEELTNEDLPFNDETAGSSDPIGEEWDFDNEAENAKRLPKLNKVYACC